MQTFYKAVVAMVLALCPVWAMSQNINHVATHFTKLFDEAAAEIVVHDKDNDRLIFTNANANSMTLLDFSDPTKLTEIKSVKMDAYGAGINSVAYYNNVIVAAVEADPKQNPGKLVFFDKDGTYLTDVTVGALPDMVTISKDGKYVITACEGEPDADYVVDPNGAVAIVDLSAGIANATVKVLDFSAYNDKMETLRNKGIRFFGPNATVAQDMEPEYVTVANDSLAYVTCQENNAIAVIDYKNGVILDVFSCRYADHSWTGGNAYVEEYFLNKQTNWPVLGTPEYGTNTPTVMLGGFSGLFYDSTKSVGGKHIFYAIPDRGPNGDAVSKANVTPTPSQNLRPFKLPNYQARIVKIVYDEATDMATVDSAEQIFLFAPDGTTPISGKGNVPGVDEVPVTYYDANSPWNTVDYVDNNGVEYTALPYDPLGGDFEGLLRDKHGNFWLCDEYRPAIYKFDSTGRMIERFIPPVPGQDVKRGLIISEYGEGTSNNKFMEFYNATDKTINFDDYLLVNNSNDPTAGKLFEFDNSGLWAGKTLAPGQVFVIAHPSAQADILAKADTTHQFLSNGDDWYAILNANDSSIVDQIGDASADPGSGWDVAGVSAGTQDHTLVRKGNVTVGNSDWAKSAGMDSLSSEWIVLAEPTADTVIPSLGFHKSLAFANLFISEYAEGTSNNKYLEFYNPTNKTIHFNDYMLVNNGNAPTPGQLFEFDNSGVWAGKTLAPGDVFIIAHPQAQADILAKADTTFTFLSNGDDWYAILNAKDSSIVDQVGDASADPGAGWDIAGVTEGTKDHTLVRKMDVFHGSSNWAASAGTDAMNSEWIVLDEPTADTVMATYGSHMPAAKFNTVHYGSEKLPMVYNKRRANRGFEAIAYDFNHDIIYSFIQSPIENPSSSVRNNSDVIRILGVDLKGNPVAEYVYLLERNRDKGFSDGRVDKMGDAVNMGNGKFRVLERDSGVPGDDESKKYIVEFTLVGATNILDSAISKEGINGKMLEQMSADELVAAGVHPVKRRVVTNLPSIGYLPSDKPEGLAWIAPDAMAVINDNDFGLAGAGVSDNTSLGIIWFDGYHAMDVSDKDDAINIDNYDVLGMRLPDAITSIQQNDKIYILTANEGDSRDYDGYSEEERVKDLTLDSIAYPNRSALQEDELLGRLKTTSTMGDYDGDGDFDQIYSYGSRSFTIYDVYGNIIFDSGSDFEFVLEEKDPDNFNSTNDENGSFDNRSDDKGGEPEAITTGVWRDSVYAFIGLERMGGIMVYNITDVHNPYFVTYFNNRDFSVTDVKTEAVGDLAPESVLFLDSTITPDGKYYLVTANEVSGTVSVFEWGGKTVKTKQANYTRWSLFPNPSNGSFIHTSAVGDYTIYDLSGRTVKTAVNTNKISVEDLEQGSYIIRNATGESKVFVRQ